MSEQEVLEALSTELEAQPVEATRIVATNHAAEPQTLAQALVAAQAEFPAVEPNAVNPHFKSKFVTLDHLIAKTRPILNKHGLAITQEPTYSRYGSEGILTPALKTTLLHVSGESRESVMLLLLGKNDMQGLGAALTYAKRYAWSAALGISADEDDDGNAASAYTGARTSASPEGFTTAEGRTAQHEKDFKAAKAIQRKLIENGLTEEQFAASLKGNYGTEHISELNAAQTHELVARLRDAEKQIETKP